MPEPVWVSRGKAFLLGTATPTWRWGRSVHQFGVGACPFACKLACAVDAGWHEGQTCRNRCGGCMHLVIASPHCVLHTSLCTSEHRPSCLHPWSCACVVYAACCSQNAPSGSVFLLHGECQHTGQQCCWSTSMPCVPPRPGSVDVSITV